MQAQLSRRGFLGSGLAVAAASLIPCPLVGSPNLLYPPMDLSYFDTPISAAPSDIRWGYAAITWRGKDRQAIDDIAALGFPGIQLRSNCIEEFDNNSGAVRDLLAQHNLTFVALSSGGVNIDRPEADEFAKHTAHAKFLHDAGGLYLQVIDDRPKDRAITPADQKRLGKLLTGIGKRTADLGISLGYHNHMGSLGERPEEVDEILESSDPRYAKLELDVAHYFQGGGDPVKAIEKYYDRMLFLHIKDVEKVAGSEAHKNYRFVELGRGSVDLRSVFAALRKVHFRGWAIVELDDVPDKSRSPKESAEISKKYLADKLGVSI
jgi:inosose dehydratase